MNRTLTITAVALIILALVPQIFPFLQFTLTIAIAKGFAALGVALLLRAGLISLGHAMYYAIGAYTTAFMSQNLGITDFTTLMIGATIISATLGLLFGLFLVRYRAIFFAMAQLSSIDGDLYAGIEALWHHRRYRRFACRYSDDFWHRTVQRCF